METGNTETKDRPRFEQEFKELPLEEKLGSLLRMEAAALEETFHYVADASVKAFNKASEVLDEFGSKVSAEFRKERSETAAEPEAAAEPKPKGGKKKASKPNGEADVNGG